MMASSSSCSDETGKLGEPSIESPNYLFGLLVLFLWSRARLESRSRPVWPKFNRDHGLDLRWVRRIRYENDGRGDMTMAKTSGTVNKRDRCSVDRTPSAEIAVADPSPPWWWHNTVDIRSRRHTADGRRSMAIYSPDITVATVSTALFQWLCSASPEHGKIGSKARLVSVSSEQLFAFSETGATRRS